MFESRIIPLTRSENEVIDILSNYYSKKLNKEITVKYDLGIKYETVGNGVYEETVAIPDINFYFEDTIEHKNVVAKITSYLSLETIEEILKDYAESLNYEYDSFQYLGGIRHAGYFVDEDTPHFDGMQIYVKEKSMKKKLI